jgi:hypothetical protein
MANFQYKALTRYDDVFFERTVAMLALALGIDDQEQIKTLWGRFRMIPPVAEKAYERQLSLFGTYPFQGSREQLGAPAPRHSSPSLPTCEGALDGIQVTTDARFVRVSGWLISSTPGAEPAAVRLLDESGREVGYAIMGQDRPDLIKTLGNKASHAGMAGYVFSIATSMNIVLEGEDHGQPLCRLNTVVPESSRDDVRCPACVRIRGKNVVELDLYIRILVRGSLPTGSGQ